MDESYASCSIHEFPAQAMLRLRPELRGTAVVILEGEAPLEVVCSVNQAAARLGIHVGMPRAQLETFAGVHPLRRSLTEEASAQAALLGCMHAFSPRVEDRCRDTQAIFLIDIAGTERLHGTPDVVAKSMSNAVQALGFASTVAITRNARTSLCLAQAGRSCVVAPGSEAEALAALPVESVEPRPDHAETLRLWGIHRLDQLAALPEIGLVTRFGQEGTRLLRMARGEASHLFRPAEPALSLSERMAFDSPIELLDSLLFVLQPMLEQLLVRARGHALALARLHLALALEGGSSHAVAVRPALPSVDKDLLLKLLHLELQMHPPAAGILGITLNAESAPGTKVQLGMFMPQLPEASRLDVTLARLRKLVGEARVGRAVLDDRHGAEVFHVEPFVLQQAKPAPPFNPSQRTARRVLRPAEAVHIRLLNQRPALLKYRGQDYLIERCYGPWYASGAWWSGMLWSREEWDIEARAGSERVAGCLVRDMADGAWAMESLYD